MLLYNCVHIYRRIFILEFTTLKISPSWIVSFHGQGRMRINALKLPVKMALSQSSSLLYTDISPLFLQSFLRAPSFRFLSILLIFYFFYTVIQSPFIKLFCYVSCIVRTSILFGFSIY